MHGYHSAAPSQVGVQYSPWQLAPAALRPCCAPPLLLRTAAPATLLAPAQHPEALLPLLLLPPCRPRIKLYRDKASGMLKGDGVVTYQKEASVQLAVDILDGSYFRWVVQGQHEGVGRCKKVLRRCWQQPASRCQAHIMVHLPEPSGMPPLGGRQGEHACCACGCMRAV